jgi:putative oxidoreductase
MFNVPALLFPEQSTKNSLGLLGFRVFLGVAFVVHGLGKLPKLTYWMGDMFPAWVQATTTLVEFGGGLLLVVGIFTPLIASALVAIMIGALGFHLVQGHPFIGEGHTYELALAYLIASLLFVCQGAGRYSIDWLYLRACFDAKN